MNKKIHHLTKKPKKKSRTVNIKKSTLSLIAVVFLILTFKLYDQFTQPDITVKDEVNIVLVKPNPYAKSINGHATVIDGDTVNIGGASIRLDAIDAPEMSQPCYLSSGAKYQCGADAKRHLEILIANRDITCKYDDKDQYDRLLAICYDFGGNDINARMVSSGKAIAYLYFSSKYANEQKTAKANKLGIWRGEFEEPYEYRSRQ